MGYSTCSFQCIRNWKLKNAHVCFVMCVCQLVCSHVNPLNRWSFLHFVYCFIFGKNSVKNDGHLKWFFARRDWVEILSLPQLPWLLQLHWLSCLHGEPHGGNPQPRSDVTKQTDARHSSDWTTPDKSDVTIWHHSFCRNEITDLGFCVVPCAHLPSCFKCV